MNELAITHRAAGRSSALLRNLGLGCIRRSRFTLLWSLGEQFQTSCFVIGAAYVWAMAKFKLGKARWMSYGNQSLHLAGSGTTDWRRIWKKRCFIGLLIISSNGCTCLNEIAKIEARGFTHTDWTFPTSRRLGAVEDPKHAEASAQNQILVASRLIVVPAAPCIKDQLMKK